MLFLKNRFFRLGLGACLLPLSIFTIFLLSIYAGLWGKLPAVDELSEIQYQRASEIYSADSVLIGKFYLYDRQPIPYQEMPDFLVKSLVAIEDKRFYEHKGVDYTSLFRVGFKTVLLGDSSSGGGSTISQQLAKNLYPREDNGRIQLLASKFKEMITARRIEKIYDKDEVLELYLNTVSFGDNTFGAESASLRFFGKRAKELKIEEAAVLTGMLKATYSYNPRLFPERSRTRRNTVLKAMANEGSIKMREADSLSQLPLELNYTRYDHSRGIAPYFREEVRKQMEAWCRNNSSSDTTINLYTSGLKIYTTLDSKMQLLAEEVMREHMTGLQSDFERSHGATAPWITDHALIEKVARNSDTYRSWLAKGLDDSQAWDSMNIKRPMTLKDWSGEVITEASSVDSIRHYIKFLNTGSLCIDPFNGSVKTWIGGIDFELFKYDHISQSRRQVGSSFKPIVYTTALEQGVDPCTHFSAQEVAYKNLEDWSPGNTSKEDETYLNYSMEEALSRSVNTVTVKIIEDTGVPAVQEMAANMGIESDLPDGPSLALGTGEIKIQELAGAYASYINHGKPVTPYLIQRVEDNKGNTLDEHKNELTTEAAFSEDTRQIMLELMKSVVNRGTASRIRSQYGLENDIAGKTGTTQKNKDAWFVALTPRMVHVTWVGLDQHEIGFKTTALGQGANAALPMFARWMQALNEKPAYYRLTRARFEKPDPVILAKLDCEPVVRDPFFKRLFKNPNKKKSRKFKNN